MVSPLLKTKIYIPPTGKYLVERGGLVEKLNQCLEPDCRLALISAPAGFGKTTLISTWVRNAKGLIPDLKVAWLSIDDRDNDPVIFWTYLVSAAQDQQQEVGQQTMRLLTMPGVNIESQLASFINDLAQAPLPFVLVLDDYHFIRSPVIHQSLSFFIDHIPSQFHLIIASRTDPPIPLALLRGRGQLLEIRQNDLRFSTSDAASFLNAGIGLNLKESSIQTLIQKTEGWIAGLQMAGISLRDVVSGPDGSQADHLISSFSGSNRYILDYLIEEVLDQQPAPIQDFLLKTSILDQLCGPLCVALLNDSEKSPDSASILVTLERSNLFISALDDRRFWYRYHQLFIDLLRKRLSQVNPGIIQDLHRRAFEWYEKNGFITQAVQHAFQAKNYSKAAHFVNQISEELWGRGEFVTLIEWITALPLEEKRKYPGLLLFQISMLITQGRLDEARRCIPEVDEQIRSISASGPQQESVLGQAAALEMYRASFTRELKAVIQFGHLALSQLSEEDLNWKIGIWLILGYTHFLLGNLGAASEAYQAAADAGKMIQKPFMGMSALTSLSILLWVKGDFQRATLVCQEGLDFIRQNGLEQVPVFSGLFTGWGLLLFERDELDEAEKSFQVALEAVRGRNVSPISAWSHFGLAKIFLSRGDIPAAEMDFQEADKFINSPEVPIHFARKMEELKARLLAAQQESRNEPPVNPQQVKTSLDGLIEPLSSREMEVLRLIAEGCSNKEIAQQLYISLRTVKHYSTGLYNKLGVNGRMQAVIRARELGLL